MLCLLKKFVIKIVEGGKENDANDENDEMMK